VHIEWTQNGTTAIETIDVLTDAWGGLHGRPVPLPGIDPRG